MSIDLTGIEGIAMATYIKVDDRFPEHPKVMEIGPLAEALWLRALCYAGRNTTDGFIPDGFLRRMFDLDSIAEAEKLCHAGLWEEVDGGYRIHDYTDWQRSKQEIEELSSIRAASGRKGGKQKASNLLEGGLSKTYPDTESDTESDKSRVAKRATQLPNGFGLDQDRLDYALTKGLSSEQAFDLMERMQGWAKAKGSTYKDWDAAWQNWVRDEAKKVVASPVKPQAKPDGPAERLAWLKSINRQEHLEYYGSMGMDRWKAEVASCEAEVAHGR